MDEFYNLPDSARSKSINENKATNYSVVRLELLDRLYEKLYHHRLHSADPTSWPHRIVGLHELTSATTTSDGKISLKFKNPRGGKVEQDEKGFDLVIVGTGYVRNSHERMLRPVKELFEGGYNDVTRGYQLKLKEGVVKEGTGIWLQGCCEGSHGVSFISFSFLLTVTLPHPRGGWWSY